MRRAQLASLALLPLLALAEAAFASDIVIGVAAPLSGPKRATGEAIRSAVDEAAQAVNAQGGLLGAKLRVLAADDGCQSGKAKTAARTLMAENARVVVGHPCSAAAVAAGRVYASRGVIFIATGARHPDVTAAGHPFTFRLAGRDDRQGEAAAGWLIGQSPSGRVAIIHDRTAYARDIAESAKRAMLRSGYGHTPILTLVAGKLEYPQIVAELRAARTEAVFFAGYPEEAAVLVRDIRAGRVRIRLLGSDSLATPEFAERIADEQDVLVLIRREPDMAAPERALAIRAAAAVAIWDRAVRSSQALDAAVVAKALRETAFKTGPFDSITFDERGDSRELSYAIARSAAGKWELVK